MQDPKDPNRAYKRNPVGRPPTLNEELIKKICLCIKIGTSFESAAAYCGVSRTALHYWMKKGNKQKRGIHRQLLNALDAALGELEVRMLTVIDQAATGSPEKKDAQGNVFPAVAPNWRAADWKLRCVFPERYAPKQAIKVFPANPTEKFSSTHDHIMGLIEAHEGGGDNSGKEEKKEIEAEYKEIDDTEEED